MTSTSRRRIGLGAVLIFCLSPVLWAAADKSKNQDYKGKVVPLAKLLEKQGAKLDADASPHWLALVTEDGKTYPLIKDDGSRMFFKDAKVLNRPMRVTGRILPDTNLMQVVAIHSYVKGELCDIYYWCNVCSIRRNEKMKCECCGGPMELREEPVKK